MNSSSRPFGLIAVFGTRGSKLHRDRVKKGQVWVAVCSALTEGKMVRKQYRRRSLQEVVEEVARLLCQRKEKDRAASQKQKQVFQIQVQDQVSTDSNNRRLYDCPVTDSSKSYAGQRTPSIASYNVLRDPLPLLSSSRPFSVHSELTYMY